MSQLNARAGIICQTERVGVDFIHTNLNVRTLETYYTNVTLIGGIDLERSRHDRGQSNEDGGGWEVLKCWNETNCVRYKC
jgi:hypothetical protein